MIDLDREEFEKLPEIAGRLKAKGIWYNEQINQYTIVCFKEDQERINAVFFVGGAWYAFQELQKKLDCCREENKAHLEKIEEFQARINKVMKYVSESPLKDVSRRAMINFMDILKGNKDEN